jgi:3-phenylpropionate/trans-cinnamate dioxygenase ferredoxin reductase subunit
LRTLDDALALVGHLDPGKRVAVIGGGVIGLEVAASARTRGVQVTVLEGSDRLMARIGPPILSDWLLDQHRAAGVEVLLSASLQAIAPDTDGLRLQVMDQSGASMEIAAGIALVAIGIAPCVDMLPPQAEAGPHGVVVDQWCRVANLPDVYAVGDVAQTYHTLYGRPVRLETWRNAERQPAALAGILCGGTEPYFEVPWMWTDQYGRNVQVVGIWQPGDRSVTRGAFGERGTACFFLQDRVVTGAVLIDLGRERRFVETLVARRGEVEDAQLADPKVALRSLG